MRVVGEGWGLFQECVFRAEISWTYYFITSNRE